LSVARPPSSDSYVGGRCLGLVVDVITLKLVVRCDFLACLLDRVDVFFFVNADIEHGPTDAMCLDRHSLHVRDLHHFTKVPLADYLGLGWN
jgi:hypothetical protein